MERKRILIVDGHSVIFSSPDLRDLHRGQSRRAREELRHRLARYGDQAFELVVVVFDGAGKEAVLETERGRGIQVFYSGAGGAADDLIERLAAKYADRYDITVATNDLAERTTVEGFGAHTISVESFWDRLDSADAGFRDRARAHFRQDI